MYTLLGAKHPDLFVPLPCQWNRQLCTYWRDHGYKDVFEDYYACKGPIFVYHGNCKSKLPE